MQAVPPKSRVRASLFPLFATWLGLVCAVHGQNAAMPEEGRQQRAPVMEVPSAQVPQAYRNQTTKALPTPPSTRYAALRERAIPTIVLPALDTDSLRAEDAKALKTGERKVRGGVMRPLNVVPEKDGEWSEPEPGVRVWRLTIQSRGAKAVKVHLTDVSLSDSTQVYIYGGAEPAEMFTKSSLLREGNIYSKLLPGDSATIEVLETKSDNETRGDDHFVLSSLGHAYRGQGELSDAAGPCEIDATCYPDWQMSGSSVGLISYVQGAFIYYCSGSVLNNDSGDFSPLFLTAAHCGLDASTAPSASIRWQYKATSCNGGEPQAYSQSNGATFLAQSDESDSTLLQVSSVPDDVTFSGWSIDPQSGAITAIHHPEASWRRISFGNLVAGDPSAPDFHRVVFQLGITEPGSSGSPLFNANHLVIGQLYGGFSSCSNPSGADVYGKLSVSFPHFVDAHGNNFLLNGLPDDRFGDITSRDKAPLIQPGTLTDLIVRYNHDDWFKLGTLSERNRVLIRFTPFEQFIGLELYRNRETTPVASNVNVYDLPLYIVPNGNDVYYIRLFLRNVTNRQPYGFIYTLDPPAPPVVTYAGVSSPKRASDYYYGGLLSSSGTSGTYWFEYAQGTDLTNMRTSPPQSYDASFNGRLLTFVPPEGFAEDTSYTFRFVADDGVEVVRSGTFTFRTLSGVMLLSATDLTFPDTRIGTSNTQVVTLTNGGSTSPLIIYRSSSDLFAYITSISDCPAALPPGGACHITVRFQPLSPGHVGGGFFVDTSAGSASVNGSGYAFGPQVLFSDAFVHFGAFASPRNVQTVMMWSAGNEPLDTTHITVTGNFTQTNDCPALLLPEAGCHLFITVKSNLGGQLSGFLSAPPGTRAISLTAQSFDILLSSRRSSRWQRTGAEHLSVGQTVTYPVSLTPSAAIKAVAVMSCGGLPQGVSCEVRPPIVDLSLGAQDVDVVVTVHKKVSRLASDGIERSVRLHGGPAHTAPDQTTQAHDATMQVTATVNGAARSIQVPVSLAQ